MSELPDSRATAAAPQVSGRPWLRMLWLIAGVLSLVIGIVGIVLPLLPTVPFVLLAAFCFARGSARCERWLLEHRLFGPIVRDWRATHAVPLRAKQWSAVMMAIGCGISVWLLPARLAWLPVAFCAVAATWLWRLPTRREDAPAPGSDR